MKVTVNGTDYEIPKSCLRIKDLGELLNKSYDLCLVNGYMADDNKSVKDQDEITFIHKGVIPDENELEAIMCSRHTPNVHNRLKKSKVAIAGLGGLGSHIAVALARIGVGELVLIDFDVVEPSNLNRQAYEITDIGKYKCEALTAHLERINPYNCYIPIREKVEADRVKELFESVDVVVEAFDNPDYKAMLVNEVLMGMDKPIVSASGMAGLYNPNEIRTRKAMRNLYLVGDEVHEAKEFEGLMAPRVIIAAGHQATTVCQILLNEVDLG